MLIVLPLGKSLKIVATMSVGTQHISTFECRRRDIYVANTPDVASDSAAEFTVTLLLMVARRCLEGEIISSAHNPKQNTNLLNFSDSEII